jgi:DNA-binding GntR family transcriptional regulator
MSTERAPLGAEMIYQTLRRHIITRVYAPGERLVEEQLAQALGVSRTPIRQALARVSADGLVMLQPNRGAVVRSFSAEELWAIYDLRALLEGYAAFHAALRRTEEHLALLREAMAALEGMSGHPFDDREAEVLTLVEHNRAFHRAIVAASGNPHLDPALRRVVEVPLQFKSFYRYGPDERARSNFFHARIYAAVAAGEAERARGLMQEHIYDGRDFLLDSVRVDEQP